ncbi:MAG: hypothetical protein IJO32_02865 [Bacilli bacterium]|nr:hypothetical protein [Bacilli bacterium]
MNIIYIISILMLLFSITLKKLTDKKINILKLITINIVIVMCYTSCLAYIFDLIHIPITLFSMTIVNLLPSLYFLYDIFKNKNINKFYFQKKDLIMLVILIIVSVIVFIMFFTKDFLFGYNSPDAAAHFTSARYFALSNSLDATINIKHAQNYGNGFQFLGFVNVGMLFKCLSFLSNFDLYKIFVIYNLFLFVLTSYSFYFLLSDKAKNLKLTIISFIITLLYALGYPLNNLLYGLFYWGIGILIINTIIHLINIHKSNDYNKYLFIGIMSLLTFGLFCSYYIFIPIIYLTLFIYYCYNYYEKKKIFSKENISLIILTLIVPFIFGFTYFVLPNLFEYTKFSKGISGEGMSYKNLISNFVLILPFIVYGYSKLKKNSFFQLLSIITILVTTLFLLATATYILSAYYFHKTYFLIWLIAWYLVYIGLVDLYYKNITIVKSFLISYLLLFALAISNLENRLTKFNNEITNKTVLDTTMDIYIHNFDLIKEPINTLDNRCVEGIKYLVDNKKDLINGNNEISTIGNYWQLRWIEALTDIFPKNNYQGNLVEYWYPYIISWWYDYDYGTKNLVIFKSSDEENEIDNYENIKVIFENDCMKIVTKESR